MATTSSIYRALPSTTSTRLVVLLPGARDSPVCVNLEVVDLHRKPDYEAVSYTWGDTDDQQTIYVNGRPVQIRKNLHAFLIRLRHHERRRSVWVDAVSISQDDLDEKAQQVAMIGSIFSQAKRVLVWLGEHADGSELLFGRDSPVQNAFWEHPFKLKQYHRRSKQDPQDRATIWAHLFDRRYWTRVWVVQEMLLAKSIVIHCGDDREGWEEFITRRFERPPRVMWLRGLVFDRIPPYITRKAALLKKPDRRVHIGSEEVLFYHDAIDRVIPLQSWRMEAGLERTDKRIRVLRRPLRAYVPFWPPTLTDTIDYWSDLSATGCQDRRDIVYALMSLSKHYGTLIPDYTIDMPELFLRVYRNYYYNYSNSNVNVKLAETMLYCRLGASVAGSLILCLRLSQLETSQAIQCVVDDSEKLLVHPEGSHKLLYAAPVVIAIDFARRQRMEEPNTTTLEKRCWKMWPDLLADLRATASEVARRELDSQPT